MTSPSGGEEVLFWILAPLMVIAALSLLFAKKAVHAAVCVMFVMVSMAILYVTQDAPFLGVVQVVVYTGAVMMLFLFVLMLVGVDASDSLVETIKGQRWIGVLLGLGLGVILVGVVGSFYQKKMVGFGAEQTAENPQGLARILFGDYVFAMEVVGILLVTAALAALVLTHRQRLTPKSAQPEQADARVAAVAKGGRLTPLAAPGVYAQNNAMDTPALDPYGQPIEESVSRILRIRGQERSAGSILAAEQEVLVVHEPERATVVTAPPRSDDPAAEVTPSATDEPLGAPGDPDSTPSGAPAASGNPASSEKED